MGQRVTSRKVPDSFAGDFPVFAIFESDLGWIGLLGEGKTLVCLTIGHHQADEVRAEIASHLDEFGFDGLPAEANWNPALKRRLQDYARGAHHDFADVVVRLPAQTPFQRSVISITRCIPYGQVMTYGELAAQAGFPRAARAVGSVMSSNRFPIVIPCHRVVAAGGKLGGYTNPRGPSLKETLLKIEASSRFLN